jgi:hypothetical protein
MDLVRLVKSMTRALVLLVFWAVMLFSMLLAKELTVSVLLFILVKALVVSAIFWVLFAIIIDAILKVMVADAKSTKVDRMEGGLSYHLAPRNEQEEEWVHQKENPTDEPKKNSKK